MSIVQRIFTCCFAPIYGNWYRCVVQRHIGAGIMVSIKKLMNNRCEMVVIREIRLCIQTSIEPLRRSFVRSLAHSFVYRFVHQPSEYQSI